MAHGGQLTSLSLQPPPSPLDHNPNILGFLRRYGTLPNTATISAETSASKLNPLPSQGVLHHTNPCNPATEEETGTGPEADSETKVYNRVDPDHLSIRPCCGEIARYARSPTHPRVGSSAQRDPYFQVLEHGAE